MSNQQTSKEIIEALKGIKELHDLGHHIVDEYIKPVLDVLNKIESENLTVLVADREMLKRLFRGIRPGFMASNNELVKNCYEWASTAWKIEELTKLTNEQLLELYRTCKDSH